MFISENFQVNQLNKQKQRLKWEKGGGLRGIAERKEGTAQISREAPGRKNPARALGSGWSV